MTCRISIISAQHALERDFKSLADCRHTETRSLEVS